MLTQCVRNKNVDRRSDPYPVGYRWLAAFIWCREIIIIIPNQQEIDNSKQKTDECDQIRCQTFREILHWDMIQKTQ